MLPVCSAVLLVLTAMVPGPTSGAGSTATAATVHGTVQTASRDPLPGARVALVRRQTHYQQALGMLTEGGGELPPVAITATDPSGRFSLQAPAAGAWEVEVKADGFVPVRYPHVTGVNRLELPPVTLLPDAGAVVTVAGASGEPVAGAWVRAETGDAPLWRDVAGDGWQVARRMGRTDEAGRVAFPRALNEKLGVSALLPDTLLLMAARQVTETSLLSPPPRPLVSRRITVSEKDGRPAAGVVVEVGSGAFPAGRTGQDGSLHLPRSTPGPVILHLVTPDGRRQRELLPVWSEEDGGEARFILTRARTLTGLVVDATTQRSLAGALVSSASDPGRAVVTDARGRYELLVPADEKIWLLAEAADYLPALQPVEAGVTRVPTLALPAAAAVKGRVVDAAGKPLAGARLEARALPPTAEFPSLRRDGAASRAVSDAAGRFLLTSLQPRGWYEIVGSRTGHFPAALSVSTGSPAAEPRQVLLRLAASRPAQGTVVDPEGRPVAGAEVEIRPAPDPRGETGPARPSGAGAAPVVARTDGAGRFTVPELPALALSLTARKEGYLATLRPLIEIPPGPGPAELGTLVLQPGATLRGLVIDAQGTPVSGASVWVFSEAPRPPSSLLQRARQTEPQTVTNPTGAFSVPDQPRERPVHVVADAEGYLPAYLLGLRAADPEPVTVRLEPASRVSGLVLDLQERPIAGARVDLEAAWSSSAIRPDRRLKAAPVRSDSQGRFVFSETSSGSFLLTAEAPGFQPSAPVRVEIPEGDRVTGVELFLEPGAVLAGSVESSGGGAVAGAQVAIDGLKATTDGDGLFRLEGLPPGPCEVEVHHPEYERLVRRMEIDPGDNEASFSLVAGWPVSGRVVDEEGRAVPGTRLELRRRGEDYREYEGVSAGDGQFTFPRAVAGSYDVAVRRAGFAPAVIEGLCEVVDGPVEGLEIRLQRGTILSGWVTGLEAEELARLRVGAEAEERSTPAVPADDRGRYVLRDLSAGSWRVTARLPGGERQVDAWVTIRPGASRVRRDLDFGGGLSLTGSVRHGEVPLAGATVSLQGLSVASRRSTLTDSRGRFRIQELDAGSYRLGIASPREALTYDQDLELEADRELQIDLRTLRFSGVVTSADGGRPLSETAVSLLHLLGSGGISRQTVTTEESGRFLFARLVPGRYELRVERPGFLPLREVLEVEPEADLDGVALVLEPAEGLELAIRYAAGGAPEFAIVSVLDGSGQPVQSEARPLAAGGRGFFSSLPASARRLRVGAPGGAAVTVPVQDPGRPLDVLLPPAGRLRVEVQELVDTSLVGTLTLTTPEGHLFEVVESSGELRRSWPLLGGTATVEDLPAGLWLLRVVTAHGRSWEGVVATPGEGVTEAVLD